MRWLYGSAQDYQICNPGFESDIFLFFFFSLTNYEEEAKKHRQKTCQTSNQFFYLIMMDLCHFRLVDPDPK